MTDKISRTHRYLGKLGLVGTPSAWKRWPKKRIYELERASGSFDWIHLGTTDASIRDFADANAIEGFLPPRTGHAGNWRPMLEGWGGALDYNTAICADSRFGAPLVYDLNQTETKSLDGGDCIYRPGRSISGDGDQLLPLFTPAVAGPKSVSRDTPRFVPFLLTDDGDNYVSLKNWHRERVPASTWMFTYWSEVVMSHELSVQHMLETAFKKCRDDGDEKLLSYLIDRMSTPDGEVRRVEVKLGKNGRLIAGERVYADPTALAESCMISFRAPNDTDWWSSTGVGAKDVPLISNVTTMLLYALLKTHVSRPELRDRDDTGELILHPHWGAIGMAGIPPTRKGYFVSQGRYLKKALQALVGKEGPSVIFLLAPAAVFLLTSSSSRANDGRRLDALHKRLLAVSGGNPTETYDQAIGVTEMWLDEHVQRMSPQWSAKFQRSRTVGLPDELRDIGSTPEFGANFLDVPMRLLCAALGVVDQHFGSKL